MQARAAPVDIANVERGCFAPPETTREANQQERGPTGLEGLARLEEHGGLAVAEPFEVRPGTSGVLTNEEPEVRGRVHAPR